MNSQWVTNVCRKCGRSSKRMKAAGSLPPRECPFCSGELASGESFAEGKTSSVLDLPPLIDGDDESSDEAPILLVTRTL